MDSFKNRFTKQHTVNLKDVKFAEDAVNDGVIVGCKSCKKPLWKVKILDPVKRTADIKTYDGVPSYDSVWSEENMKDISKFPQCPHCGKSWIDAITGPGGTLFPKPYIL